MANNPKNIIPQTGVSLGAALSKPWARRVQLYERVPANKSRADWAQGVERSDGRAMLNRCGDRRVSMGWAGMEAGDGM